MGANGFGHHRRVVKDTKPVKYTGVLLQVINAHGSLHVRINGKEMYLPSAECQFVYGERNEVDVTMPTWMAKAKGLINNG